ncbi:MAG TPA: carboxy terminal-processing peptidase [Steroidobacteraceae bacterium]|nr:carboxy terminal-processing peptidase [Steroidobacteraceae bacterium]
MNSSIPRPARWLAPSMVAALLVLTGSAQAPANTQLPAGSVVPSERHRSVARRVGSMLEGMHYSGNKLDDRLSAIVYTRFLESIDGQHTSLLASDIADFEQYKLRFDDMIRSGDVDPAFAIFARFQQRNRDRIKYAITQLDKEPDWTLNESFEFDREKAPWATTQAELDDWWRKRVKNDALSLLLTGKNWDETSKLLHKRYETTLKRVDQVSADDVFESLMNSYARAYDPHSSYFSPRSSEEYRIQMSLNYDGIGASLQLVDDYVTIMNVIEGGPAAVAGTLSIKDRITGVGQGKEGPVTDVLGWRIDDVVQLIRGRAGTQVRLQVLPAGAAPGSQEKTLEFTRNKVTLEAQAAQKELRTIKRGDKEIKVGIINVPAFYQDVEAQNAGDKEFRSTTRDVRRLIGELKAEKIDGLVLDLRGNGGGYLPEATALTGLFIDKGPVVQLKVTTGELEVQDDPEPGVAYSGPLAVLVDRFSASASEIFAGALQDYHRATILGQRTFGKGTVQNLVPLDRWSPRPVNGQLTVTIGKFYRVTGESTQHRGVEPDVSLPSQIDMDEFGESALQGALPWDRIPGVPFRSEAKALQPNIAALAGDEKERAEKDPDYRWLVADLAAAETVRKQTSLSLNLQARKAEREKLEKDRLDRENARRSAQNLPALKTTEELADAKFPDTVLDQASEVMTDMVTGVRPQHPTAPARTVKTEPKPERDPAERN